MDIRPIRTNDDHDKALLRIDALMNAESDTAEGAELDVLVTLVEAFENEHFPIPAPDPGLRSSEQEANPVNNTNPKAPRRPEHPLRKPDGPNQPVGVVAA